MGREPRRTPRSTAARGYLQGIIQLGTKGIQHRKTGFIISTAEEQFIFNC